MHLTLTNCDTAQFAEGEKSPSKTAAGADASPDISKEDEPPLPQDQDETPNIEELTQSDSEEEEGGPNETEEGLNSETNDPEILVNNDTDFGSSVDSTLGEPVVDDEAPAVVEQTPPPPPERSCDPIASQNNARFEPGPNSFREFDFDVEDYAVADDGSISLVSIKFDAQDSSRKNIHLHLADRFNGPLNSQIAIKAVDVPNSDVLHYTTWVIRSRKNGYSVIFAQGRVSGQRRLYFKVYNENGTALSPLVLAGSARDFYRDIEVDNSGNVYVAWLAEDRSAKLRIFSQSGAPLSNVMTMAINSDLQNKPKYATHLAINPETGCGIITFQGNYNEPIAYQQFKFDGTWRMPEALILVPTMEYNSSYYNSHDVFLNQETGEAQIIWADNDEFHSVGAGSRWKSVIVRNVDQPVAQVQQSDLISGQLQNSFRNKKVSTQRQFGKTVFSYLPSTSASKLNFITYDSEGHISKKGTLPIDGSQLEMDQIGNYYLKLDKKIFRRSLNDL